ncbi:hypothetical protein D3C84_943940 [compost metagenome]
MICFPSVLVIAFDVLGSLRHQFQLPGSLIILLSIYLRLGEELAQRPLSDDGLYALRGIDNPHVKGSGVVAWDLILTSSRRSPTRQKRRGRQRLFHCTHTSNLLLTCRTSAAGS